MWVAIAFCAAAVALLLGPIMMMQPSASQRRLTRFRELAVQEGLRVHLQKPPKGVEVNKPMPFYCLPLKEANKSRESWELVRMKYEHELHYCGCWAATKDNGLPAVDVLKPFLESVPDRVVAITYGHHGIGVFWNESGQEEAVLEIAGWLKSASDVVF